MPRPTLAADAPGRRTQPCGLYSSRAPARDFTSRHGSSRLRRRPESMIAPSRGGFGTVDAFVTAASAIAKCRGGFCRRPLFAVERSEGGSEVASRRRLAIGRCRANATDIRPTGGTDFRAGRRGRCWLDWRWGLIERARLSRRLDTRPGEISRHFEADAFYRAGYILTVE